MAKKNRTPAEWVELLTKQRISGQGVKEWCTANGINVNSMYNRIAKYHKKQTNINCMRTTKTAVSGSIKNVGTTDKPAPQEWKELKTIPQEQREAVQRGSVYVEIGGIRLAADAGYPVTHLAALCKELVRL